MRDQEFQFLLWMAKSYLWNIVDDGEECSGRQEILLGPDIPQRVDDGEEPLQGDGHRDVNGALSLIHI